MFFNTCAMLELLRGSIVYYTILYYTDTILYYTIHILYYTLSHALKNTANQRPGLPMYILGYAMGNTCMQRVVFHSTFPSLLVHNSLLGYI